MTEQEIIENQKLMHFILNKYKEYFYDIEDFYEFKEDFIINYIRCCKNYDETQGISFSAYLSQSIYAHFCNYFSPQRKQCKRIERKSKSKSLQEVVCGATMELSEIITDNSHVVENRVLIKQIMDYLKNTMNKRDYKIFIMYIQGYTQQDIGEKFQICQVQISRVIKKARISIKNEFYFF